MLWGETLQGSLGNERDADPGNLPDAPGLFQGCRLGNRDHGGSIWGICAPDHQTLALIRTGWLFSDQPFQSQQTKGSHRCGIFDGSIVNHRFHLGDRETSGYQTLFLRIGC